ncbi:hypothetical protein NB311A_13341 [Nitrobacter sp. Nb-311A]|nr:hypothetical protein NB311A_13341 [Nitrobacter sp. Nb-311A]
MTIVFATVLNLLARDRSAPFSELKQG